MGALERYSQIAREAVAGRSLLSFGGRVSSISPTRVAVEGLGEKARLGDLLRIGETTLAQVVQMQGSQTIAAPFCDAGALRIGELAFVEPKGRVCADDRWLGRVVDALGQPLDDGGPLGGFQSTAKPGVAPKLSGALNRGRVHEPLKTGVRTIDIFAPLCFGQRIGIFAGSGVGKSTLLSMLARSEAFDIVVIALVGERSREVREFLEDTIGDEGRTKTVCVVATGDESPMLRRRAPELALDVCESFREAGKSVLLLMDSVTRYAHALREIGIASGEPPVARGYPASVFNDLSRLLERAGPGSDNAGSITAIATVLVDGDDHNDPVADTARGILDGHLVLDRAIAEEGRYPAIDPLASISRLAERAWQPDERELVLQLRRMISRFEETRDLRTLGAWQPGSDGQLDKAVETVPVIYEALCQNVSDGLSADPFNDLVSFLKGNHGKQQDEQAASAAA